jgi:hypothetical protein
MEMIGDGDDRAIVPATSTIAKKIALVLFIDTILFNIY